MPKKLTREELIERAKTRYGDKYDFSRVVYDNFNSEIIVGCRKHGFVKTKAYGVLRGTWECPMCRQERKDVKCYGADKRKGKDHKRISYLRWGAMMHRCYSSSENRDPSYLGCTVCEEWHSYERFRIWFSENYVDGYALDKDLLIPGNKVYSPQTCCFLPPEINTIFKGTPVKRDLPRGIRKTKVGNYEARLGCYGRVMNVGTFTTIQEAVNALNQAKHRYLKELAVKYYSDGKITKQVYDALIKYKH